MSKILFVGAEAMPFAATGGLGDVMGSLPAAIHAAAFCLSTVNRIMPCRAFYSTPGFAEILLNFCVFCYVPQVVRTGR